MVATTVHHAVHLDPGLDPATLRATIYAGDLVLLSGLAPVAELAQLAADELTDLLAPYPVDTAHEHLDPAAMAERLGWWKPRFIHSPTATRLVRDVVRAAGLDDTGTYYDLPKPRTSFPAGHLSTGIGFAFPWHRDTWYSAPQAQINWWLPVLPVRTDNAMGFDLSAFDRPVANSSARFDYYVHNALRGGIATQVQRETISRPEALDAEGIDEVVVLPPVGSILLFSGAHVHRSIPNASGVARYSVDFRTVDLDDLVAGHGAPAVDVDCRGTSLRDFRRVADDADIDEALVRRVAGEPPEGAVLRYEPSLG